MSRIRTIFFDLDDTLVDNAYAQREALRETYERFRAVFHLVSLDALQRTFDGVNDSLWAQLARGEITESELRTQRFLRTLQQFSTVTSLVKYDQRDAFDLAPYFDDRFEAHTREVPEASATLRELGSRYPLGLLTNGARAIQLRRLGALGWSGLFAHVITPDDAGAMKPDAAMFAAAERVSRRVPGELAFVGDSHHYDVAGAKRRGWHTIWFNPRGETVPDSRADAEVRSLGELVARFVGIPA